MFFQNRKASVLESLFNKVADLKACNFIEKERTAQVVNVAKCLATTFLIEHLGDYIYLEM